MLTFYIGTDEYRWAAHSGNWVWLFESNGPARSLKSAVATIRIICRYLSEKNYKIVLSEDLADDLIFRNKSLEGCEAEVRSERSHQRENKKRLDNIKKRAREEDQRHLDRYRDGTMKKPENKSGK